METFFSRYCSIEASIMNRVLGPLFGSLAVTLIVPLKGTLGPLY